MGPEAQGPLGEVSDPFPEGLQRAAWGQAGAQGGRTAAGEAARSRWSSATPSRRDPEKTVGGKNRRRREEAQSPPVRFTSSAAPKSARRVGSEFGLHGKRTGGELCPRCPAAPWCSPGAERARTRGDTEGTRAAGSCSALGVTARGSPVLQPLLRVLQASFEVPDANLLLLEGRQVLLRRGRLYAVVVTAQVVLGRAPAGTRPSPTASVGLGGEADVSFVGWCQPRQAPQKSPTGGRGRDAGGKAAVPPWAPLGGGSPRPCVSRAGGWWCWGPRASLLGNAQRGWRPQDGIRAVG